MRLIPKAYDIFSTAIEDGVRYGYRRAFKHDSNPSEEQIFQTITEAVMNSVFETFDVDWEKPVDSE